MLSSALLTTVVLVGVNAEPTPKALEAGFVRLCRGATESLNATGRFDFVALAEKEPDEATRHALKMVAMSAVRDRLPLMKREAKQDGFAFDCPALEPGALPHHAGIGVVVEGNVRAAVTAPTRQRAQAVAEALAKADVVACVEADTRPILHPPGRAAPRKLYQLAVSGEIAPPAAPVFTRFLMGEQPVVRSQLAFASTIAHDPLTTCALAAVKKAAATIPPGEKAQVSLGKVFPVPPTPAEPTAKTPPRAR